MIIISHLTEGYDRGKPNGAYYYSREIVKNIIPNIQTDRNWVTINIEGKAVDNSIVFIHNNKHTEKYNWLKKYQNLVLVCGIPETVEKVKHLGRAIYLPLSVDVKYVEMFKRKKDKDICYVGRKQKRTAYSFSSRVDFLEDMERDELLQELARYRKAYAVGRCAIEAKILGCEVLNYDIRFESAERWKILDNSEVIPILQKKLDEIDKGGEL